MLPTPKVQNKTQLLIIKLLLVVWSRPAPLLVPGLAHVPTKELIEDGRKKSQFSVSGGGGELGGGANFQGKDAASFALAAGDFCAVLADHFVVGDAGLATFGFAGS